MIYYIVKTRLGRSFIDDNLIATQSRRHGGITNGITRFEKTTCSITNTACEPVKTTCQSQQGDFKLTFLVYTDPYMLVDHVVTATIGPLSERAPVNL